MTALYSEIKRNDVSPHVLPHNSTTTEGNYSVLSRDDTSHVPLYIVTSGGDCAAIRRDDVRNGMAAGEYSVLKREEREVS